MKKLLTLFFLLFLSVQGLKAQEKSDLRIFLGPDYKFNIEDVGAHAGFEYFFADKFAIAPNFTYWFPNVGRTTNLNMDLRYYLTQGVSQIYVLGGYSNYWINTQPGTPGVTVTRSGGNFGMGAYIRLLENIGFNTEVKIQSQNNRQPVLRMGLVFSLN